MSTTIETSPTGSFHGTTNNANATCSENDGSRQRTISGTPGWSGWCRGKPIQDGQTGNVRVVGRAGVQSCFSGQARTPAMVRIRPIAKAVDRRRTALQRGSSAKRAFEAETGRGGRGAVFAMTRPRSDGRRVPTRSVGTKALLTPFADHPGADLPARPAPFRLPTNDQ